MEKKKNLKLPLILIGAVLLVSVVLCICLLGGNGNTDETTVPTTTAATEPATEPAPQETLPLVEEEEPTIIQAGHMKKHMKGKNGDDGIYFSMEPNEVPADTTWKTEYRPTSKSVIKLIRDGETYEIGKTAGGMLIKYNETDYYLKLQEYLIRDYFPIRDNDIIVVEGVFRHGQTLFQIEKSYMLISEGLVFYTTEYPEGLGVTVKNVGRPTAHQKGMTTNGIYFTLEENSVPYNKDWSLQYSPTSEANVQLIRNGKTYNIGNKAAEMIIKYNETSYFLKTEQWIIKDFYPIRDGDIIVLSGKFVNSGVATVFNISKTYIAIAEGMVFFSEDYPKDIKVEPVKIPTLQKHPKGFVGNGLYFKADANSLPYNEDWSLEYYPREASCIKLIRNGETKDIANVNAGTIIKYGENNYFLKLEQWIYQNDYPFVDGDILVIEGKFVNAGLGALMEMGRTYIYIAEGMALLSTEYPTETKVEVVKIPIMQSHPNGFVGNGLYFKADKNSLPYNEDWSLEYYPRAATCIKLIRNGETKEIGNVNAAALIKYSETNYFLKLEQWIYKDYYPFVDGDILVVEGKFVNSGMGALMEIGKTYISISSGMAYLSAEYPTGPIGPTKVQAGAMTSHPNGWNAGGTGAWGGLFFRTDANDAPYASDWSIRYVPTDVANVKLIRDGVTYNVANTGAEMLAKYGENDYYLEFWPISEKPMKAGDILIVEGNFVNAANDVVLCVEKTYITLNADGTATFESSANVVLQAGHMSSHANGWNSGSNDGLYFTLTANEVPFNSDWSLEYEPASSASLKLVRGGETFNIGQPGKGTIVKYGNTDYYLKLAAWTIGDYFPIVPGDVLIVEGEYKNAENGVTFAIDRSVITVGEGYVLTFAQEENVDDTIQAGAMISHSNGWNTSGNNGLYFTMTSNDIPYSDDWTTLYTPTATNNIQLIRDGKTYEISKTDREYIVKYSDTGYYLKLEKWTIGDYFPIVPGDVIVVGGVFTDPIKGVKFAVDTTYISVGENYALAFSKEAPGADQPEEANDGAMLSHSNGWNSSAADAGGLYFRMTENAAPFNTDWTLRYNPEKASNVKLIRDGVTYNVANSAAETIVKYSETDYLMAFWPITQKPLKAGDVLIVEGKFTNATSGATINIAKTTITLNADGTATFQSDAAEEPEVPDQPEDGAINAGAAQSHASGWQAGMEAPWGGLYFEMKENEAPFNTDWSLRYTPEKKSNIKLIRNGVSYDVANIAAEMIAKFGEKDYYLEFWPISEKPVLAGDVLVIEGKFTNAASGVTINIAKTTITLNADGTATFQSEEVPEEPEVPEDDVIAVGAMLAHSSGITDAIIYFDLAQNDLPTGLTKSDFRPVDASTIKLIRNGVTYDVANPDEKTIVKQTASKYRLLRIALTMELQEGDVLVVDGKFTGGNTDAAEVYTISVSKTYITIGDGTVSFSTVPPEGE